MYQSLKKEKYNTQVDTCMCIHAIHVVYIMYV